MPVLASAPVGERRPSHSPIATAEEVGYTPAPGRKVDDMDEQEYFFANLSSPKVAALLESPCRTVLLFPIGSTEAHGPHAPLATDMVISMGMCRRAARQLRGDPDIQAYILPPLSYGVTRYAGQFPGTIHVSEATLQSMLVDICSSLIQQEFTRIVLVN